MVMVMMMALDGTRTGSDRRKPETESSGNRAGSPRPAQRGTPDVHIPCRGYSAVTMGCLPLHVDADGRQF